MYGSSRHPSQAYPASENPYNAFKLHKKQTKEESNFAYPRRYPHSEATVMPVGTSFWYGQMVPWRPLSVMQGHRKDHRRLGLSFLAYNL